MKICKNCGVEKPLTDFYKLQRGRLGTHVCCKPCHNERSKQWRKNNRLRSNDNQAKWRQKNPAKTKRWSRETLLRTKYNMCEKDYQVLLEKQSGVCAICKTVPDKQRLYIDHCHANGRVRGLLCHFCNVGIGNLKESPERLLEAIKYLQK